MDINTDAFSHGQVTSKLWLCEEIEPHLPTGSALVILGGWYNLLGFMLECRRPGWYQSITSVDLDPLVTHVANRLTDAWFEVSNLTMDANVMAWRDAPDAVVNCSVEHFSDQAWYDRCPEGTLVCIQSSDVTDPKEPWLIRSPNPDMDTFLRRFPVKVVEYVGTKRIQYPHFGYNRFMLIGRK